MAPKFDIPLDNPIYLFRSETMVVSCNPSGGPIPQKTWFKDNIQIEEATNRMKVLKDGGLEISDVNDLDAGEYTCRADNKVGEPAQSSGMAVVLSKWGRFEIMCETLYMHVQIHMHMYIIYVNSSRVLNGIKI